MFLSSFPPPHKGRRTPYYGACSQVFLRNPTDGKISAFLAVPAVPGEHQEARFSSRRWEHLGNTSGEHPRSALAPTSARRKDRS